MVELSSWSGKAAVQASIWRCIGLRKSKESGLAEQVLSDALSKCTDRSWPYPLLAYLGRRQTKEEILRQAETNEQKTQAHCVLGFAEDLQGHKQVSIKDFEWIEKYGDLTLDEFVVALNELAPP